ncbi:hypothetical protein CTAYLR_002850 [Chrysophaeum taylorii]|uniref:Endonuclease/exonuclease/phosphatase domain-containing protein n=1 Tax=Chrysophaeum taylorii TaxID=2483200 RepID=A0AAD7U882_9STRA|nr:hypothetical protein CTAYLR_002850 [Chrysophaeum taylorii]
MGVALAWPSSIQLESMHVVRPADRLPAPPRVDDGFFRRIWNHFVSPRPFDTWHEALRKQNTLVVASFEDFCVAVYHMPCLFGSIPKEQVMVIHATLAANAARDLAGGKPYVLAGDFNIKPFDQAYALLTSGSIQNDEYLPPPYADFEPTIQEPLVSAYKACLGAEPDFTNFAFTKYNKDCFIETLDYIFCSPHWHVQDVKRLKSKAHVDLDKPYPDQHEPSDHVLLAADLALKKS